MKKAMFILGAPGSGKDYIINNILSRYSLSEVQMDQILSGTVNKLIESGTNLLINGNADLEKIKLVKSVLEGYSFSHTLVSVTNKVSKERNISREKPLNEAVRVKKWLEVQKIKLDDSFVFENSINIKEANKTELDKFKNQIENYLRYIEEVLEWGTDETTKVYKEATPGQLDTKPKLTLKPLRKRGVRGMPSNAYNSRVGGVDYAQTGSWSGASYAGGLVNSHTHVGNILKEISKENLKKYLEKSRDNINTIRANSMDRSPNAYDYYGDDKDEAEFHRKTDNRQTGINRARRLLKRKK